MTDAISMNYLRIRQIRGRFSWKKTGLFSGAKKAEEV